MSDDFTASCQYDDSKGTVAVDWDVDFSALEYLRKNNVDTDKYQPIGVSVNVFETRCDISLYIQEKGKSKNAEGKYPLLSVHTKMSMNEFIRIARRLNIELFLSNLDNKNYYVDKSIDIDDIKKK